jgi:hypothetical protein
MKRNVSVVRFKFSCNILISGKIITEMPGSVASGTPYRKKTSECWFIFKVLCGQGSSVIDPIYCQEEK